MGKVFGLTERYTLMREGTTRFVVRYGIKPYDEKNSTWYEVYFNKKQYPDLTLQDVKDAIYADINAETDRRILEDFVWEGKNVWLSSENQFNFKAAYDLAVQTKGKSLPVKFKIGETADGEPVYHTFEDMEEFTDFYTKAIAFINTCLNEGWELKDSIDWSDYEAYFPVSEQS